MASYSRRPDLLAWRLMIVTFKIAPAGHYADPRQDRRCHQNTAHCNCREGQENRIATCQVTHLPARTRYCLPDTAAHRRLHELVVAPARCSAHQVFPQDIRSRLAGFPPLHLALLTGMSHFPKSSTTDITRRYPMHPSPTSYSRSMTVAIPWPTPIHIVASP